MFSDSSLAVVLYMDSVNFLNWNWIKGTVLWNGFELCVPFLYQNAKLVSVHLQASFEPAKDSFRIETSY